MPFTANRVPGFKDGQFQAAPDFSSYSTPNDSSFFGTPHFDGANAVQAGVNAISHVFPGVGILAGLGQGFNLFGQAPSTGNKITDIAGTSGVLQNTSANVGNWLNRLLGGTYMPDSYAAPTMGGPSQDGGQGWNQAVSAMRDGTQAPMGSPDFSPPAPYQIGLRNEPDYGNMSFNPGQMDFGSPQGQPSYQVGLRNEPTYAPMSINPGPMPDYGLPVVGGMDNGRSQSVQGQQNGILDLQSGKYTGNPFHFDNTQMGWNGPALQNLGGAGAYTQIGGTPFAAFGSPDNGGQGTGPSVDDLNRWNALNNTGNRWDN